jgi:tetratricopeptide (TPR) repeat protein
MKAWKSKHKQFYQMINVRNFFIPLAAVIALVLGGCHHDSATMSELARIDSMVYHQHEKEALPLLLQMKTDQLSKQERAYHTVLLSMAMYKNYVPCTSDSAINEAVSYYRNKGDDLKYLKALVAQGCVNEDMGQLEQAVESYHHAEQLPLATDSSMIAYAKLRLGVLYQEQVIGSGTIALEKYHEALPLYRALGDKHYELVCLTSIGGIYRNIDEKHDSAVICMKDAIALAQELGDQYHAFANRYLLSEYYLLREQNYVKSKKYALQAVAADPAIIDHPRAHYRLATSYLNLGRPDSAVYYLNRAPRATSARDSIVYLELMSDLEHQYRKNDAKSKDYMQMAHAIADSLTINGLNHRLLEVEKKYDHQLAVLKQMENESRLKEALLLAALLALGLLALTFLVWRYRNQLKMRQNEVEMLKADLNGSLASLEQMQARLDARELNDESQKAQSDELRAIITQQIDAVHQLMAWSYQYDGEKFAAKFREMMTVPGMGDDSSYWSHLQVLVNELHDNVLVKAQEEAGGTLNESELNLLALYCCGFSRTVIMVCMDYKNIGTVYNKKMQIAKKLHVTDLDEFVARVAR